MSSIKFGTDGWRAVIGKDFIPENIGQVIQAFADIYESLPHTGGPIVIGYDRRAKSRESAKLVAEILTGNNIRVILSKQFCPTPCVSWTVVENKATAGVMITASHNPANWNGIKFKESYGGAASPEYTNPIEKQIAINASERRTAQKKSIPNELCETFDPNAGYVDAIKKFVDLKAIQASSLKVLVDPMYGSGCDFFSELLEKDVTQINGYEDTTFGGSQPEPIPPHVNDAMEMTKKDGYDLCLITDGDADRIGAVDENGNFVSPQKIFPLILKHLVEKRKWKGKVIKSLTTTRMLNVQCEKYGIELVTTPVGFKYISPMLNSPDVLMGGEESGGIGIPRHVCERDGLVCGLLILEIMALSGKKMGELIDGLQKESGPFYYKRVDLHLDEEIVKKAKEKLDSYKPTEILGKRITKIGLTDGYHFLRDDESWLLVRSSGTEPLLRTYAEARTPKEVEALLGVAKELIGI